MSYDKVPVKFCDLCSKAKFIDNSEKKGIGPNGLIYRRNICRSCTREQQKIKYRTDSSYRQRKIKSVRKWWSDNTEEINRKRRGQQRSEAEKIAARVWFAQNKEHVRRYLRKQQLLYPQKQRNYRNRPEVRARIRAQDRARRKTPEDLAKRREYTRQYRALHPEYIESIYASKKLREAQKLNAPRVERISRKKVIARDQSICYICKQSVLPDDIHLDHVIPLSRGGSHTYDNIRVACRTCNLRKHNKLPEELGLILDPLPSL